MITIDEILKSEVRALSWKAPFAEMMLHGKKETRVWDTNYRGLVLICCSKAAFTLEEIKKISGPEMTDQILARVLNEENFDGHAFAIGRLIKTHKMTEFDQETTYVLHKGERLTEIWVKKHGFEDLKKKPLYVHTYADVRRIVPFAWAGFQGWKKLDPFQKMKIKLK